SRFLNTGPHAVRPYGTRPMPRYPRIVMSNADWLSDARRTFEAVYGPTDRPITLILKSDGHRLGLVIEKDPPGNLSESESTILQAANKASGPVTSKKLAALAGYGYTSYFRGIITAMVRKRLLERRPDGLTIRTREVVAKTLPNAPDN